MFIFGALINKNAMKKRFLFTMLAAVAVLLSCSKTNEVLEDQTKNEESSGDGGFTIKPPIVITDTLTVTEVLDDDVDNDTIPVDAIPKDTIPVDTIPKDTIPKNRIRKEFLRAN